MHISIYLQGNWWLLQCRNGQHISGTMTSARLIIASGHAWILPLASAIRATMHGTSLGVFFLFIRRNWRKSFKLCTSMHDWRCNLISPWPEDNLKLIEDANDFFFPNRAYLISFLAWYVLYPTWLVRFLVCNFLFDIHMICCRTLPWSEDNRSLIEDVPIKLFPALGPCSHYLVWLCTTDSIVMKISRYLISRLLYALIWHIILKYDFMNLLYQLLYYNFNNLFSARLPIFFSFHTCAWAVYTSNKRGT